MTNLIGNYRSPAVISISVDNITVYIHNFIFIPLTVLLKCSFETVLLAHNGFVYDYPLLYAELKRREQLVDASLLSKVSFGDTLQFVRQVRNRDLQLFI